MKVPVVKCPKCGAELRIDISDDDLIKLLAKRLKRFELDIETKEMKK